MFAHALSIRRWRAMTSLYVATTMNATIATRRPTAKAAAISTAIRSARSSSWHPVREEPRKRHCAADRESGAEKPGDEPGALAGNDRRGSAERHEQGRLGRARQDQ